MFEYFKFLNFKINFVSLLFKYKIQLILFLLSSFMKFYFNSVRNPNKISNY